MSRVLKGLWKGKAGVNRHEKSRRKEGGWNLVESGVETFQLCRYSVRSRREREGRTGRRMGSNGK